MNHRFILNRVSNTAATLCYATFLAGCSIATVPPAVPAPTPVVTPILGSTVISQENVGRMAELMRAAVGDTTPVAAIGFTEALTGVVVAHRSGNLRHLNLPEGHVLTSLNVTPLSVGATVLNKFGDLLATVAGDSPNAVSAGYSSNLDGMQLWDVSIGRIDPKLIITSTIGTRDVALSADGRLLLESGISGFSILDSTTRRYIVMTILMNQEGNAGPYRGLDAATIDEQGEYIALADQNGLLGIHRVLTDSTQLVTSIETFGVRGSGQTYSNPHWRPAAIAFDSTRHWLALVASGQLLVFKLQPVSNHWHITISSPSDPSAALAFSPRGDLLATGTARGWQIWDVAKKKLLAENKITPVYALTFSSDGRLFAVGDVNGAVHVWGIPSR